MLAQVLVAQACNRFVNLLLCPSCKRTAVRRSRGQQQVVRARGRVCDPHGTGALGDWRCARELTGGMHVIVNSQRHGSNAAEARGEGVRGCGAEGRNRELLVFCGTRGATGSPTSQSKRP